MCKFSHLAVNEIVTLDTGSSAKCNNCGTPFNYTGNATYLGHQEKPGFYGDLFNLPNVKCKGCGITLDYGELCQGDIE